MTVNKNSWLKYVFKIKLKRNFYAYVANEFDIDSVTILKQLPTKKMMTAHKFKQIT